MATFFSTATHFLFILLLLSIPSVSGASNQVPEPSADCSNLILNMADCLSFVSNGSTEAKPPRSCCAGLKTVLKTNAECLCEVFKSTASLGVTLNITKASTLPAACKLHAPSICGWYNPTDVFFINCGAISDTFDTSGRNWTTERQENLPSDSVYTSFYSHALFKESGVPQVPYMSARIFRSDFTYSFPVSPGWKFLRLYFYPSRYGSDFDAVAQCRV